MTEDSEFCVHVSKQEGYFLASCQGQATLSRVLSGWECLARRCFAEGVNKIICQPHLPGPSEFLDVYQFGHSFRDIAWPSGMRIGIVCRKEDLDKYRLAEAMVSNLHGPESGIFASLEEARDWLLDRK